MLLTNFKNIPAVQNVKEWYLKFERPLSSIFMLNGFVVDIFALKRVDEPLENFFVAIHLCVAALGILLLHTV